MKKTFIIECDSEMSTVFLYEATEPKFNDDKWIVERGEKITNRYPDPKFYGVLDSLLITSDRIAEPKEVVPDPVSV